MGWSPQIPITRAIQRNEQEISRWRIQVWPELKKQAKREHKALTFIDESGFYWLPGKVRTYAPKGLTPVVQEWQTRDHLSVMGALMLRMVDNPLLVIWDRSPIHRRKEVKEFVARAGARLLHLEELPAYAPDLNPVEWAWHYLKQVEMRNMACLDLEELHMQFHLAVGRLRRKSYLVKSFFSGAGLEL